MWFIGGHSQLTLNKDPDYKRTFALGKPSVISLRTPKCQHLLLRDSSSTRQKYISCGRHFLNSSKFQLNSVLKLVTFVINNKEKKNAGLESVVPKRTCVGE